MRAADSSTLASFGPLHSSTHKYDSFVEAVSRSPVAWLVRLLWAALRGHGAKTTDAADWVGEVMLAAGVAVSDDDV